jgi:predicted ribosomally synthesized peptide with nif11-like leader
MSRDNVNAFLDRLAGDEEFRRQVGEALEGRDHAGAATASIAGEAGFEFTEEELEEVLEQRSGGRELGDADLETVSGGASGSLSFPDVSKSPRSPSAPTPVPYPSSKPFGGSGKKKG